MEDWQLIASVPNQERVLVYAPQQFPQVFEAIAEPDGSFSDPVYHEWDGTGATHWMPKPAPPARL
jgi:hypothetical protein